MKNKYLDCLTGQSIFCLRLFIPAAFLLVMASCKTTKQSQYFKTLQTKDTTLTGFVNIYGELKIVKGDRLAITASSISTQEDALFNGNLNSGVNTGGTTILGGYFVEPDGTVFLHRVGRIMAEGFTRREFARQVENKLLLYMKDPIVQVSFTNHKITILGAVGTPQVLNMPEEQIPLLDALVLSGDIKPDAKRNSITIIREEGTEKKVKHLNLEDNSIFNSPWYYVKPNDIILVGTDTAATEKAEKRAKLQTTLSLVASAASLLIILLNRVIK